MTFRRSNSSNATDHARASSRGTLCRKLLRHRANFVARCLGFERSRPGGRRGSCSRTKQPNTQRFRRPLHSDGLQLLILVAFAAALALWSYLTRYAASPRGHASGRHLNSVS